MKSVGLCCLLLLLGGSVSAQTSNWVFGERVYFEPLRAEPRAATTVITFPAWSDEVPFVEIGGKRVVWDVSLGKEIPLFGWESQSTGENSPVGVGNSAACIAAGNY